jgi:hypothetical protein
MWRKLYPISWGVIIVNGVVGSFLELGLKVVYPPVLEWVIMFVPLCFFGYVAGYWAIGKVRHWNLYKRRVVVLTQRGQT